LTSSPPEKFAKLLLSWSPSAENATEPAHLKLTLTHEEIAEMIGTTRETVSRLFADFKKKQLLQLKGFHIDHPQLACPGENRKLLSVRFAARRSARTDRQPFRLGLCQLREFDARPTTDQSISQAAVRSG
jgi:hypothetical protein